MNYQSFICDTKRPTRKYSTSQIVSTNSSRNAVQSGYAILTKVHSHKTKPDMKWEGLYPVLLTSGIAVRVAEK